MSAINDIVAPDVLSKLQGWLVWRYEPNPGKPGGSLLKVPYYVSGSKRWGEQGSERDRKELTTFEKAREYAAQHGFTGPGLALLPEYGLTAIDFDDCINELTGDIHPDVVSAVSNTYTEISPSGEGIRAFVIGKLGNGKSYSDVKAGRFGFELFENKGFVTFTGNVVFNKPISEPSTFLTELIQSRWQRSEVKKNERAPHEQVDFDKMSNTLLHISADCGYHEWWAVGAAINYETDGSEDGFTLWDSWSANSSRYSSEEYNRSQWDAMGRNTTSKPVTFGTISYMANGTAPPLSAINDFTPIPKAEETKKKPENGYFNIRTSEQFLDDVKSPPWLIKGLLPKGQLGMLFGESGSGKSFMTLDLCASLARGENWNFHKITRKHKVLYVVAEGVAGFSNRIRAYKKEHCGADDGDLGIDIISDVSPNLLDKESVHHLIQDIEQHGPYDLVVMDTFAQVTPGSNENSGEEMGLALSYCKRISDVSGAMVLLVHHSGKDASKGARGWSGFRGPSDVMLCVTRDGSDRKMSIYKGKDGEDGKEFGFTLKSVILGKDEDGDDITSCTVEYCAAVTSEPAVRLSELQQFIINIVKDHDINGWITPNNLLELCLENHELKEGEKLYTVKGNIKRSIQRSINVLFEENKNGEIRRIK